MSLLKTIHMLLAFVVISSFIVRFILLDKGVELPSRRWLKVLPHVLDTLLLASGITLAVNFVQYPAQAVWLSTKLMALFVYVLFGVMAMGMGRSRRQRWLAFSGAMLSFAYVLAVAVSKDPLLGG